MSKSNQSRTGSCGLSTEPVVFRDRFLFDPVGGMFFSISGQASWILGELRAGKSRTQIEEDMVKKFSIKHGAARRDVEQFLTSLARFGLSLPEAVTS